jgi:hypothetical protein
MGLDERERRLLAALEEHTVREDPALAQRFATVRWRTRRLLPVAHLGLLVVALGVLTGVHVLVPDLHGLASAAITVVVVGSWLVLSARTTPPIGLPLRPAGGVRPAREGRTRDTGHGGPPACV